MKAASFDYARASDLEHALALLHQHGFDAKLIAGGQSLVPMMAMRLVRPAVLVDIHRLPALRQRRIEAQQVRTGAAVRQRELEDDAGLLAALPLLRAALAWVGHTQTRNRGTVGGSLAHADPAAELPLAAAVLGATLHLRSQGAERGVAAADFFQGAMATALHETEVLVEIDWPRWEGPGVHSAFDEVAMRQGDFAMASAACQLQIDAAGVCRRAALGIGALDGAPRVFPALSAQLIGQRIDARLARDVAQAAAAQTEPGSDLHADADYRRELGAVLMVRVLMQASAAATAAPTGAATP